MGENSITKTKKILFVNLQTGGGSPDWLITKHVPEVNCKDIRGAESYLRTMDGERESYVLKVSLKIKRWCI